MCPLLLFALLNRIGDKTVAHRLDLTVAMEGYPVSLFVANILKLLKKLASKTR
jgi:hypothetical protein